MWERGDRHFPLSARYIHYLDNRPILPQDPTQTGFLGFRRLHDPYQIIYYYFLNKEGKKIIISSNIPASDRESMKVFMNYYTTFMKNVNLIALLPAIFLSGAIFSFGTFKQKYLYLVTLGAAYYGSKGYLGGYFSNLGCHVMSYYYYKYAHLAVDNLNQIEDPRRKFFRPDTSTYYRETPQEIYDRKSAKMLHDSSIYYGPHPFDDHENVESVLEINNKFMDGVSSWDVEGTEQILGESIDIKRNIRRLPIIEEYRNI